MVKLPIQEPELNHQKVFRLPRQEMDIHLVIQEPGLHRTGQSIIQAAVIQPEGQQIQVAQHVIRLQNVLLVQVQIRVIPKK